MVFTLIFNADLNSVGKCGRWDYDVLMPDCTIPVVFRTDSFMSSLLIGVMPSLGISVLDGAGEVAKVC
jgi:hypothetical protein